MLETPQSPQVIYSIAVLLPLGLERFFLKGFFAFFFPFASNSISWFTMRSHNHHRPGEHVPPFPFCKPYNPLIIFFFFSFSLWNPDYFPFPSQAECTRSQSCPCHLWFFSLWSSTFSKQNVQSPLSGAPNSSPSLSRVRSLYQNCSMQNTCYVSKLNIHFFSPSGVMAVVGWWRHLV